MLTDYLHAAMRHAEHERLEDGSCYAHIPGLPGLWASGANLEDTRNELFSALDDWLYVNADGAKAQPPEFDGISPLKNLRVLDS
jgi:hypothetical protein